MRRTTGQRSFRIRRRRSLALAVLIALGATFACSDATASQEGIAQPRQRITIYPIDSGDAGTRILFGAGKVWALRGNDLRPFDLRTEALAGTVDPLPGGPVFVAGSLWSLRLDLDHECAPSSFPYLLVQIDTTSNSVIRSISLPDGCRYINDNRNPSPLLVGGGDAVWITGSNRAAVSLVDAQIARVDTATGSVATTSLPGTRAVVAADERGAWVAAASSTGRSPRFDNYVRYLVAGPVELNRIDQTGAVVGRDLLPSARFQSPAYVADAHGLWVMHAKANQSSTKKWTVALTRVTPSGERMLADRVSPWSVATGDGQVWFLGTRDPERTAAARTPRTQLLGRIDPKTGSVVQTIRLHLPVAPPSMKPPVVKPRIVSVMGGGVWIDPMIPVGPARQRQLIRVAI